MSPLVPSGSRVVESLPAEGPTETLTHILALRDSALATEIIRKMPPDTYTSISVNTRERYTFGGMRDPTHVRVINFQVNPRISTVFRGFFAGLFAGFGLTDNSTFTPLDPSTLKDELIDHICDTPSTSEQIRKAYARCTNVVLLISQDGRNIEMEMLDNTTIMDTYLITKTVARTIDETLGRLLYSIHPRDSS